MEIGNRDDVMETLLNDILYGMRNLRKHPGFTTIAVLTLALGIGANTAIFSVVKSVLLRPLPYAQAERLAPLRFYVPAINHEQIWVALRDVVDWQAQSHSFERIGIYRSAVLDFTDGGLPEAVYGLRVSADLLPALGVAPVLGHYFSADEDQPGRNHVIVLSDDVWRRRFNAD